MEHDDYCRNCGTKLAPGTLFCSNCGCMTLFAQSSEDDRPSPAPANPLPETATTPSSTSPGSTSPSTFTAVREESAAQADMPFNPDPFSKEAAPATSADPAAGAGSFGLHLDANASSLSAEPGGAPPTSQPGAAFAPEPLFNPEAAKANPPAQEPGAAFMPERNFGSGVSEKPSFYPEPTGAAFHPEDAGAAFHPETTGAASQPNSVAGPSFVPESDPLQTLAQHSRGLKLIAEQAKDASAKQLKRLGKRKWW